MKIAFLGDIALIGKYDLSIMSKEAVFARLQWAKVILEKYDYVIANLETPLTNINSSFEAKAMPLRSNTMNVNILKYLGVNAVSLANNHVYDYGNKGIEETINTLKKNGIEYFGVDDNAIQINDEGILVNGFCCYTANGWHYDSGRRKGRLHTLTDKTIKDFYEGAISSNCYPIMMIHWGEENTHYPQSEHVLIAKKIMDQGNCSIIGHHPHVPQGLITNDNGVCAFSLGNFIFDDCYSAKTKRKVIQTEDNKEGYILVLNIENKKLIDTEVIPYHDTETGIEYYSDWINDLSAYNQDIECMYGTPEYERKRQAEQKSARIKRLGKRDIKWFLKHMNYSSVIAFLHGKENNSRFLKVVDAFSSIQDNVFCGKEVIYVGNFGMPNTNAAGKRVYGNSLVLSKLGKKTLMVGTDPGIRGDFRNITEDISYVSFPQFGKLTGNKYYKWFRTKIDSTDSKPEMIIRYGSPGLAVFDLYLYLYCKRKKIPIVVDVVDWLNVDSNNQLFSIIKKSDTYLEKAIFNKLGNGIITISSYLKQYYDKYYEDKIIIPPLVEDYTFQDTVNDIPQIVYAGTPFRKGEKVNNAHNIKDRLDIAVSVLRDLERSGILFDFHIIGISREEYLMAFPEHETLLDGSMHIHFYGLMSMQETQQMIKLMDYSILLRERTRGTMAGFPTKLVESMSLGVPVITTDTSDITKYIESGVNGFIVDISRFEELEQQLYSILTLQFRTINTMKQRIFFDRMFQVDNFNKSFGKFFASVELMTDK